MLREINRFARDCQNGVHVFLVLVLALFSFLLELPGDMFSLPPFRAFAELMPEHSWAYCLAFVAMIGGTGLATSSKAWLRVSLFFLSTTHGIIAVELLKSTTPGIVLNIGTMTYSLIALLGYYLFWLRTT